MPGACRGKRRVSDPLELELLTVVSCPVDAGNETVVLWKNSRSSNHEQSLQPYCFEMGSLVALAGLKQAVWPKMTLNSWSCLHTTLGLETGATTPG